jgi:hypothetical protein
VATLESRIWTTIVIAVPCLLYGGFDFIRTASFVARSEAAEATVVGVGDQVAMKGYPVALTFSDSNGQVQSLTLYSGRRMRYPPGTTAEILFKIDDPSGTARFARIVDLWALPGSLLLLGAAGLTAAMILRRRGN